jgi:hypothetical protein
MVPPQRRGTAPGEKGTECDMDAVAEAGVLGKAYAGATFEVTVSARRDF